jgi:hypothetical protein
MKQKRKKRERTWLELVVKKAQKEVAKWPKWRRDSLK